jgi:hypothetical protein
VNTRRSVSWILLASVVSLGVAACSSSTTAPKSSPSSHAASATPAPTAPASATPAASSAPTSGPAAEQSIKANWTAFFNPKTTAAQKVGLLQNGSQFAAVLQAQANNPQGATSSSKVTKVTITSPSQATVTYEILLSGTPVLTNQKGIVVYQEGTWKVGVASFCGLLALQGAKSSLPAACKSAA